MKPQKRNRKVYHVPPEWAAWMEECDALQGYVVCGRPNRFDEPCIQSSPEDAAVEGSDPYAGRAPCRYHGGKSGVGVANVRYVDGNSVRRRYALRGRLAQGYEDELADLNYLALHDELATVTALIQETLDVLDDPEPCPEPWPEPPMPPDKEGKFSVEAQARNGKILERQMEIQQWHAERADATARYDSLTATKTQLARTEIMRVKAAQDTVAGPAVRLFAQRLLEVNRRHWIDFGKKHSLPVEDVLAALAAMQEDFVNVVRDSRGVGTNVSRRGAE